MTPALTKNQLRLLIKRLDHLADQLDNDRTTLHFKYPDPRATALHNAANSATELRLDLEDLLENYATIYPPGDTTS